MTLDQEDQRRQRRRDVLVVAGVALFVRLAVVAWAWSAIPPTADGAYYHKLAVRVAEGHGYTWLWSDGAVTYAAHYPVGYPAIVALGYAIFGAKPAVAMMINALIGAGAAVAAWSLVARARAGLAPESRASESGRAARRRGGSGNEPRRRSLGRRPSLALLAGLAVALHPVLVPYTAAIMTEGVTASLLVIAAALAAHARDAERPLRWLAIAGVVMGIATLVRPQSLVLAPVLGWLATTRAASANEKETRSLAFFTKLTRLASTRGPFAAALVTALALAVCAPWTARNCARMDRCALVSVNGGWNLAIGTQTKSGGWHEIAVPDACKTVFQEAEKDACFGREARKVIAGDPVAWLARVPAKLRATFDYFGAAPWYLHDANPSRFPYRAKVALGAIETLASRLLLAAALATIYRWNHQASATPPPPLSAALGRARKAVAIAGLIACVAVPGFIGYLALALATGLLGRRALAQAPLVVPFTALVILATAVTHAVFFGAGRYGMVVVPFVTALAFVRALKSQASQGQAPADEREGDARLS